MNGKQLSIFKVLEGLTMLILGLFGLWFSLSENYELLMNAKFRWLSISGFIFLLILGVFTLITPSRRSGINTIFFGLLILMVLLGSPYLPNELSISQPDALLQKGLWDQIDQNQYPRKELSQLSLQHADSTFAAGSGFTTIGIVKRLETLEEHKSFALMTTFMYCCLADQFGTGFRVSSEQFDALEDGQWIMVSGNLDKEKVSIDVPNFRFGTAMFSSINEDYHLKAVQILTYDRKDQLPMLSEVIQKGEKSQGFIYALKESGLLEELGKKGPYTIFLPVDEAIEELDTPLEEMSSRQLKKFTQQHIVSGLYSKKDLTKEKNLKTLNRKSIHVELVNGKVRIQESRLLFTNTEAQNGIIHFIYPAL